MIDSVTPKFNTGDKWLHEKSSGLRNRVITTMSVLSRRKTHEKLLYIHMSTTYNLIHKSRTHIYYKYNIYMNMYIEQNLQWQEISHEGKTYNSKNNV